MPCNSEQVHVDVYDVVRFFNRRGNRYLLTGSQTNPALPILGRGTGCDWGK